MDNKKIVELLKILKKIYVCEMAEFNTSRFSRIESFDIAENVNMDDLNALLEENGVNTLDVIESCYNVKNVMEDRFAEDDCYEKSPEGVKEFFYNYECIKLSDNEANDIYEKYLKNK